MMDFRQCINDLETELTSRKGVFGGSKIDVQRCLQIIDSMTIALPSSIRDAEYIVAHKEEILGDAQALAKNTVSEAEMRAEQLISDSEILRRAETEAARILEDSKMRSDTLIQQTREYLEGLFKDTEQYLMNMLATIRNNREELRDFLKDK